MSAKDFFREAVRKALEKEKWVITNDPLMVKFGKDKVFIDLAAERVLTAEREGEKIAVEIKSFLGRSDTAF